MTFEIDLWASMDTGTCTHMNLYMCIYKKKKRHVSFPKTITAKPSKLFPVMQSLLCRVVGLGKGMGTQALPAFTVPCQCGMSFLNEQVALSLWPQCEASYEKIGKEAKDPKLDGLKGLPFRTSILKHFPMMSHLGKMWLLGRSCDPAPQDHVNDALVGERHFCSAF